MAGNRPPDTLALGWPAGFDMLEAVCQAVRDKYGYCDWPWYCMCCGRGHARTAVCRELRDATWTLVKDRTPGDAYHWARAELGLDEHR